MTISTSSVIIGIILTSSCGSNVQSQSIEHTISVSAARDAGHDAGGHAFVDLVPQNANIFLSAK